MGPAAPRAVLEDEAAALGGELTVDVGDSAARPVARALEGGVQGVAAVLKERGSAKMISVTTPLAVGSSWKMCFRMQHLRQILPLAASSMAWRWACRFDTPRPLEGRRRCSGR